MKAIRIFFLWSCWLLLLTTSCVKRETSDKVETCSTGYNWVDSSAQHPKNAVYSKLIHDLTSGGFPGISVMIEDQYGLWYGSSGYADLHNKTPMQPCHLGKIASVTKLFTATMIYMLVDQGRLNLDDPISKYIDADVLAPIKNAGKCRVRDLLRHSSGIYDVVFDPEFILYTFNNLDKPKTYSTLLSFAYNKPADFEYNSQRSYNQTLNHVLLALVINGITGKDQSEFLKSQILEPLQMNDTYLRPQMDIPWNRVAKGYFDYRKEGVLQDLTPLYTGDGRGFTGIYTNVNDLRIFTNALFKQKTLISNNGYNEMVEIPSLDTTLACAGGCRAMRINVNGRISTWYGHPGGEVNYAAGAFYSPDLNATITFTGNYGVAFTDMGISTDQYYAFRKKLFEEVTRP